MSRVIWLSFLSYNLITSITPGPMNIIAMNTAGSRGLQKSRPVFAGLTAGLAVVILLCGLFSSAFAALLPQLVEFMKYIGSAYILWIGWIILRSRQGGEDAETGGLDFKRAFLLQFVNVKAYIWAITVYSAFVLPVSRAWWVILAYGGMMLLTALLCALIWAVSGTLLSRMPARWWRIANTAMAVMLVLSAVSLLLS